MRRKILKRVSPLAQHHLLPLGGAEDDDVESHRAEDHDDHEDSQEDSFLVIVLLGIHQLLNTRSRGESR